MNDWERQHRQAQQYKEAYPPGTRLMLLSMNATFCRDRKKKGEPEISFEEWIQTIGNQSNQEISSDIKWYPTTTANTTPATYTTTTTATAAAATTNTTGDAAATANSTVGVIGGELGKGVVFLSDEQVEDLLDKMNIDVFDHYVDKLSTFILNNGAHVKNHYETILKWWREDSRLEEEI